MNFSEHKKNKEIAGTENFLIPQQYPVRQMKTLKMRSEYEEKCCSLLLFCIEPVAVTVSPG